MGEVEVGREGGELELEVKETEEMGAEEIENKTLSKKINNKGYETGSGSGSASAASSVVRWERFLPKMVVRILLVEADDSTRQIIAALLRKCSYRVAAVPDGLKAWEVLKGRPHDIDLILTEVELPSISGYALLTLIMEHDICKNIPVIMMSSHDSVSTVYKCMLRGAADFLVKPVRKNELRNLWQHVWRRQVSSCSGVGPPDESIAQQKVEATAENNAVSNHSSGYMACIQRNRECIEKGSDAQSSCTKPELDAEGADTEHVPEHVSDDIAEEENSHHAYKRLQMNGNGVGGHEAGGRDANAVSQKDEDSDNRWEHVNVNGLVSENNQIRPNSSKEAIDLIGAFDNYAKDTLKTSSSNTDANKTSFSPLLDLSLRRNHPSGSVNQVTDERHKLNHSDASAFSRYKNLQPRHSASPRACNQQNEYETSSHKQASNHAFDYSVDKYGPASSQKYVSVASVRPGPAETSPPYPQQRVISVPIPVRGVRLDAVGKGYGSIMPPLYHTQSGMSPLQSPGAPVQSESSFQVNSFYQMNNHTRRPYLFHNLMEQRTNGNSDQSENKQGHNIEIMEDQRHVSSATDQSGNSSFCNGAVSHFQSNGSGSSGKIDAVSAVKGPAECANQDGIHIPSGMSHRSIQREAALTKFRLKRKDRSYEKKVRYESRKKLAEQRPRVKGQFVRQVHADAPSGNSSAG